MNGTSKTRNLSKPISGRNHYDKKYSSNKALKGSKQNNCYNTYNTQINFRPEPESSELFTFKSSLNKSRQSIYNAESVSGSTNAMNIKLNYNLLHNRISKLCANLPSHENEALTSSTTPSYKHLDTSPSKFAKIRRSQTYAPNKSIEDLEIEKKLNETRGKIETLLRHSKTITQEPKRLYSGIPKDKLLNLNSSLTNTSDLLSESQFQFQITPKSAYKEPVAPSLKFSPELHEGTIEEVDLVSSTPSREDNIVLHSERSCSDSSPNLSEIADSIVEYCKTDQSADKNDPSPNTVLAHYNTFIDAKKDSFKCSLSEIRKETCDASLDRKPNSNSCFKHIILKKGLSRVKHDELAQSWSEDYDAELPENAATLEIANQEIASKPPKVELEAEKPHDNLPVDSLSASSEGLLSLEIDDTNCQNEDQFSASALDDQYQYTEDHEEQSQCEEKSEEADSLEQLETAQNEESHQSESDHEDSLILQEIIKNSKMKEEGKRESSETPPRDATVTSLPEEKSMNENKNESKARSASNKDRRVNFELDSTTRIIYKEDAFIQNLYIQRQENVSKIKKRNFFNYNKLLKSKAKPKSILRVKKGKEDDLALQGLNNLINECPHESEDSNSDFDEKKVKDITSRNIKIVRQIQKEKKKGRNYIIKRKRELTPRRPIKKEHCKKFKNNPMKFFTQPLCDREIKSLEIDTEEKQDDSKEIEVSHFGSNTSQRPALRKDRQEGNLNRIISAVDIK